MAQRGCAATGRKKDFVTEGTERAARDTEGTEGRKTPHIPSRAEILLADCCFCPKTILNRKERKETGFIFFEFFVVEKQNPSFA